MLSHIIRHAPIAALVALVCAGCSQDRLSEQYARYKIEPDPTLKQVALENPVGINYQETPISAPVTATFRIENISPSLLEIRSLTVASATNGEFVPVIKRPIGDKRIRAELPFELDTAGTDGNTAYLVVTLVPTGDDGSLIEATIDISTNAGQSHDEVIHVQLRGVAKFIGDPNLEIVYNSKVFRFPESCVAASPAGKCRLETLDFGNVSLSSSVSTKITLRNVPIAGTCQLRNLSDDPLVPDCTPACGVTFDRNAQNADVGLGFVPATAGFGLVGGSAVPFMVAPSKPDCPEKEIDPVRLKRGDLDLEFSFQASDTPGDAESTLVLESNDPDAPIIEIPMTASSRAAPVAVARLRECGLIDNPPPACTNPATIEPLKRIYFEGADSYDPGTAAIVSYRWEVVQFPDGASPIACDFTIDSIPPNNQDCVYRPNPSTDLIRPDVFDMNIPLAGDYVMRLHVTNSDGVESGISATSDVEFGAVPSSRLHLQVTWDHPTNDQDLHMVHVDVNGYDLVYHGVQDCFWGNCRPSCGDPLLDPDCTPVVWFTQDAPFTAGNPRLDRDDTNGIGPENINIDNPEPGRYRIYVHYYGLTDSSNEPTSVTVRIFIDGLLRQEYRNTLNRNDLWAVAELVWAADDSAQVRGPDPSIDAVQQLIYLPPASEGFAFSPSPF